MNNLAEVGVEDGVDDRVECGVEVAQPGDEHRNLGFGFFQIYFFCNVFQISKSDLI